MITNRSRIVDYRRWYDVVAFVPAVLLVVFVGLPLLSILQTRMEKAK